MRARIDGTVLIRCPRQPPPRRSRPAATDWDVTYTAQKTASLSPTKLGQQAWLGHLQAAGTSGHAVGPIATVQPTPLYLNEGAPLYAEGLGSISLSAADLAGCRPRSTGPVVTPTPLTAERTFAEGPSEWTYRHGSGSTASHIGAAR